VSQLGRPATIEDVARIAGVSRAAVSKVIRNAYGVSPGMRERVSAAIDELDYRPSVAARAMRGSSFTLGIETPGSANHFFAKILDGAAAALVGTRYQLIIAPAEDGQREGYRALEALVDRQVDGLVAVSPLIASEWLERLATRIPVVMLGRHDDSVAYDTVVGDDELGARLATEHLFELGHTRIAHLTRSEFVTIPSLGGPHGVRLAVYNSIMHERGLEPWVCRTGPTNHDAYESAIELLNRPDRPSAVFAAHDQIALGVLKAMAELGLTPDDVSVVGYDDVEIASHPGIGLTTVNQSGTYMGATAVEMLIERIDGRTEVRRVVTTPRLVARTSSRRLQK